MNNMSIQHLSTDHLDDLMSQHSLRSERREGVRLFDGCEIIARRRERDKHVGIHAMVGKEMFNR